jgi:hypothetical protein
VRSEYLYERKSYHEEEERYLKDKKGQGEQNRAQKQNVWVKGGRPLDRALSESPSREEFIVRSKREESDGRGPYRPTEKVTDSMQPHDGSREDRQRSDGWRW